MNFKTYISMDYHDIKLIVKRNCWNKGNRFDEDIFDETITKCLETIQEDNDQETFRGYVIKAYNINLARESQYSYNKCSCDAKMPDESIEYHDIDIGLIYEDLTNKYGAELIGYFKEWLSGYSVKEVEEMHGVQKLTYRFKKIKEYISKNYT